MYRLWSLALIVTVVVLLVLVFSVGVSGLSLSGDIGGKPLATPTASATPIPSPTPDVVYRTYVPSVTGK